MSIFNEIGLAIGKGTEGIGAKAKVIRESSKLSFMVGEEEKKLTNYYQRIGQIYADIHKNDYESEFTELMSLVEESKNNLIAYRRQSEELKQTHTCPVCGRTLWGMDSFAVSVVAELILIWYYILPMMRPNLHAVDVERFWIKMRNSVKNVDCPLRKHLKKLQNRQWIHQ